MMKDDLSDTIALDGQLGDETLSGTAFFIPSWLRLIAVGGSLIVLIVSIALFAMYVRSPQEGLEPGKIGIANLIIFSFFGIVVFLIPWEDYGLRISKFGPFEFDQILSAQAQEHAKELVEIRERLQKLEESPRKAELESADSKRPQKSTKKSMAGNQAQKLRQRLSAFLGGENSDYAFSPSRIVRWGPTRSNFTDLKQFQISEVRRELQSMVADGEVRTQISKKGNTLYRISS